MSITFCGVLDLKFAGHPSKFHYAIAACSKNEPLVRGDLSLNYLRRLLIDLKSVVLPLTLNPLIALFQVNHRVWIIHSELCFIERLLIPGHLPRLVYKLRRQVF